MSKRATEGTCLAALVRMARASCRAAERRCPRTGRGRPPAYADAAIATLIVVAVLHGRKTKSAQYRFLYEHRRQLLRWLGLRRLPARSTFFRRYGQAHPFLPAAIREQGRRALREGVSDAEVVAVDKSMVRAAGPQWNQRQRKRDEVPQGLRGLDREADWGYSKHQRWVYGYSFEVVVTATKGATVLPLLASADGASASEHRSFGPKIPQLPRRTRYVLADRGYDNNRYGEAIEYHASGRRTGRRFLCPPQKRPNDPPPGVPYSHNPAREPARRHRQDRKAYLETPKGQRLSRRRGQTVEPFNEWFKNLFDLEEHVWHRGLDNNKTQLLAAIFCYQLLLRYNHRRRRSNGQIKWILDGL